MNRNDNYSSLACVGTNVAVRPQLGMASSLHVELALPLHALPPTLSQSSGKRSTSNEWETTTGKDQADSLFRTFHTIPPTPKQRNRSIEAKMAVVESISSPLRPHKSERGHLAIAFEIMEKLEAEFSR